MLGFMIPTMFLSMWISNTATTAMMVPIVTAVLKELDRELEVNSFFCNEPELGVGIDPGMALTPLPSSIGCRLNPRPSDHEPSAPQLDHGFRLEVNGLRDVSTM